MIGALLMSLLADVVFGAASASGRSYQSDFSRYLIERGFVVRTEAPTPPAR